MKKLFWAGLVLLGTSLPLTALAASGQSTYGLGIEGFYDKYREPDLDVSVNTTYGSLTAYYSHQLTHKVFFALDGRASYGTDHYDSPSGELSGVPQWEFELRGRVGYTFPVWGGAMSPYTGLGLRYFMDEGKGYFTDTGAEAYDRDITQLYIPVGTTFAYAMGDGWSVTPQAEGDFLFYGNVDTRLTNITQGPIQYLDPANNTQHYGFGARSEVMFGKDLGGYSLQAGPFVRYWYVPDSDKVTYQNVNDPTEGIQVYEPKNSRLQLGVALRVLF